MPIYEFRCVECGSEFEELCLSSRDMSSTSCPQCKNSENEGLMSLFAMSDKSNTPGIQPSTSKSSCATCSATSCKNCSGG